MQLLQHYCKAAVPNFFSGQTTDHSSVSERVPTISSTHLIFLHLKLTSHVLHMQNKLTAPGSCRCRVMFWGLLALETGNHQKGGPQG